MNHSLKMAQLNQSTLEAGKLINSHGYSPLLHTGSCWDVADEIIEVNTLKTETYTRFEIDVIGEINSPLTIKNITNNTFFALDI